MNDAEAQVVGGLADDREVQAPFHENRLGDFFLGGLENHEHALLAFGQHHFIGSHALFAHRHGIEVKLDAEVALGAHFHGRAGEAGGAHVLNGDDRAGFHQFEAGFQQALFREGVADLNGRALFFDGLIEFGRGHGRAANAIAAGLCAEINHRQANALGFRKEDRVGLGKTGGKGINEDVAVITRIEFHFAANRWHAEGVAVAANTGNDTGHEMAGLRVVGRAEAQGVHGGNRARAHGEDVTQDTADAGRRTLIGLDIGGMVMALHLEDDAIAIVDIHNAGIFTGALDDAWSLGGQGLQPLLGGLVGAVLVPHGREDAELGKAGLPSDQVEDTLVFVGLQPVGCNEFRGDLDGVWNRHRSHAVRAEGSFRFFSARGSKVRQENARFYPQNAAFLASSEPVADHEADAGQSVIGPIAQIGM